MISQLVFGECFTITEEQNGWLYIQNKADQYLGWIEKKQITLVTEQQVNDWINQPKFVVNQVFETLFCTTTESSLMVPAGVEIPINSCFTIGTLDYKHNITPSAQKEIIVFAKAFLNAPYLWGGKTVMGFDCSGFSQTIFKAFGTNLPRDAWQQAEIGTGVDFLEETQAGDLAFFHNAEGKITHVGIMISPTQIIHCSGSVRIDSIDHQGIFNQENGCYSHDLRFVKRVLK
jgi:hypothetical protein